jgi:hypothetical protein
VKRLFLLSIIGVFGLVSFQASLSAEISPSQTSLEVKKPSLTFYYFPG